MELVLRNLQNSTLHCIRTYRHFHSVTSIPFASTRRYNKRVDIMQAISAVRYHGSKTNTAAALRYVRETMFTARNGDRANAKNVVLLVTDGSSDNGRETIKEARAARDANIQILVSIVGTWVNMQEINAIASYPVSKNKFQMQNFQSLDRTFADKIYRRVCNSEL